MNLKTIFNSFVILFFYTISGDGAFRFISPSYASKQIYEAGKINNTFYEEFIRILKKHNIFFEKQYKEKRKNEESLKKFPADPVDAFKKQRFRFSKTRPSLKDIEGLFIQLKVTPRNYAKKVTEEKKLKMFPKNLHALKMVLSDINWEHIMSQVLPLEEFIATAIKYELNATNYKHKIAENPALQNLPPYQFLKKCYPNFSWKMVSQHELNLSKQKLNLKKLYRDFITIIKEKKIYYQDSYRLARKNDPELRKFPKLPVETFHSFGFSWNQIQPSSQELKNMFIKLKVTPGNYTQAVNTYPQLKGLPTKLHTLSVIFPYLNWSKITNTTLPMEDLIKLLKKYKVQSTTYTQLQNTHPELKQLPKLSMLKWIYPEFTWKLVNQKPQSKDKTLTKKELFLSWINTIHVLNIYDQFTYLQLKKTHSELKKFPQHPESYFEKEKFVWISPNPKLTEIKNLFIQFSITPKNYNSFIRNNHYLHKILPLHINTLTNQYPELLKWRYNDLKPTALSKNKGQRQKEVETFIKLCRQEKSLLSRKLCNSSK